jgi:hypothetical protein
MAKGDAERKMRHAHRWIAMSALGFFSALADQGAAMGQRTVSVLGGSLQGKTAYSRRPSAGERKDCHSDCDRDRQRFDGCGGPCRAGDAPCRCGPAVL